MKQIRSISIVICLTFFLASCKFSCSVGGSDEEPKGTAVEKDGARLYNNIKLTAYKANLKRAYLEFEDRTRVPDDNFIDFSQPVKLMLAIDGGWVEENGKVLLGASEKIIAEDGRVVLDEKDLFESYSDGIKVSDSKLIFLTAALKLREGSPPTSFSVQFRIWDKKAEGYIEGSYMLFSK